MAISLLGRELLIQTSGKTAAAFLSEERFTGVSFDSRQTKPGELFLALPGEYGVHGHAFLDSAFEAGAQFALVEDEKLLLGPYDERLIAVSDSTKAFQNLAHYWRKRVNAPVLAITGSVGKTTTKELARALLKRVGNGTASSKSFNNHIGVPYTLCQLSPSDAWCILEVGMNHAGELEVLSKIAEPDVAVINGVAPVHLEFFDSLAAIARAKLEIAIGVARDGVLVLNGDDTVLMAEAAQAPGVPQKVETFGAVSGSVTRVDSVRTCGFDGIAIALTCRGKRVNFDVPILGAHNATNIAAALAGVTALFPDYDLSEAEHAFLSFEPPPMRLNVEHIGNKILIDDCYNANPVAMRASLKLLSEVRRESDCVAVILGDMRELGPDSARYHREIGSYVRELGFDYLIAVGNFREAMLEGARGGNTICTAAAHAKEAGTAALALQQPNLWLVKASRGVGLDVAVGMLRGAWEE